MGKKGFTMYLDHLQKNVNIIRSLFKDYRIIILHQYYDLGALKNWTYFEPKLILIEESFKNSKSICHDHETQFPNCRTRLLAHLRNQLIDEVSKQFTALNYSANNSFIISFDLDDINNNGRDNRKVIDKWKVIDRQLLCKTMNETNIWDMVIIIIIIIISII